MGGIRRDVVVNPVVNEFVYDAIVNSTHEQRRKMPIRYVNSTRNSKRARTFSSKSTIEEKAIVLANLGIPFGWYFNITKPALNKIYEEHKGDTNVELTNLLLKEKILVVSDRDMMQFMGLLSSNCHGETWMLNRDFFTHGHRINEFKKIFVSPTNTSAREVTQLSKEICKFILDIIMCFDFSESLFNISNNSLNILLFLFVKNGYYVEEDEIKLRFKPLMGLVKIGKALKQLQVEKLVEKSVKSTARNKQFIITGIGRDTVLKFQKKIFNLSNF